MEWSGIGSLERSYERKKEKDLYIWIFTLRYIRNYFACNSNTNEV